jgi:hypothetical protein
MQRGGSPNEFHRKSVAVLRAAEIPFLIGGAYVVEVYAGVSRSTKDFDLYVRPNDLKPALHALAIAGYETELTFPHWLAKSDLRRRRTRSDFSRRQRIVRGR